MRQASSFWTWGKIIVALLVAVAVIPLLWLWFARWIGEPAVRVIDSGGLLGTIGGVMGAIFTVGGLVIALVAVLTQLALKDRIDKAIADATQALEQRYRDARQDLDKRYEQELRPELERRAKAQVAAQIAYFKAGIEIDRDWESALDLARQALAHDPELEGVRSFVGLRLSHLVASGFRSQHGLRYSALPTGPDYGADYFRIVPYQQAGVGVTSMAANPIVAANIRYTYGNKTVHYLYSASPLALPVLEAIEWLEEALAQDDEVGGRVAAELALMYGVSQRFDKMDEALSLALQQSAEQRAYLRDPEQLPMLAHACGDDTDLLAELGTKVGVPLPAGWDDVERSMEEVDAASPFRPFVDWYVLPCTRQPGTRPDFEPAVLRLFVTEDANHVRQANALYFPHEGQSEAIPSAVDPDAPTMSLPDLAKRVDQRFLCLCMAP